MPVNEITKEFVELFNEKEDFYECHERFELAWKSTRDPVLSGFFKALVQVATAQFKLKKGLLRGVRKLHGYSMPILMNLPDVVEEVDISRLRDDFTKQVESLPSADEIGEDTFLEYGLQLLKIYTMDDHKNQRPYEIKKEGN